MSLKGPFQLKPVCNSMILWYGIGKDRGNSLLAELEAAGSALLLFPFQDAESEKELEELRSGWEQ